MSASPPQSDVGLKERFFRDFQHNVAELQVQMEHLSTTSPVENGRNDAVDHCLAGIDRLSHEVKDASSYIPAYDQRTYSQTIKALSEKLQAIRNTFNPPKKFSFKTRKNASVIPPSNAVNTTNNDPALTQTPLGKLLPLEEARHQEALGNVEENSSDGIQDGPGVRRPSFSNATKIAISKHSNLHLVLPSSASHATSSGTISSLQHCVMDLSRATSGAPFSALYLKNIKDSLIVCGQVAGAIHITNVKNSVLVISCRQFRMHGSKSVDVYLHSASRPIIEDCEDIRFAPLPDAFVTYETSSQAVNQWNQIDDFKWLKVEASPNFSLLAESQRVDDEVWRDKVLGHGSWGLDDVLNLVKAEQRD